MSRSHTKRNRPRHHSHSRDINNQRRIRIKRENSKSQVRRIRQRLMKTRLNRLNNRLHTLLGALTRTRSTTTTSLRTKLHSRLRNIPTFLPKINNSSLQRMKTDHFRIIIMTISTRITRDLNLLTNRGTRTNHRISISDLTSHNSNFTRLNRRFLIKSTRDNRSTRFNNTNNHNLRNHISGSQSIRPHNPSQKLRRPKLQARVAILKTTTNLCQSSTFRLSLKSTPLRPRPIYSIRRNESLVIKHLRRSRSINLNRSLANFRRTLNRFGSINLQNHICNREDPLTSTAGLSTSGHPPGHKSELQTTASSGTTKNEPTVSSNEAPTENSPVDDYESYELLALTESKIQNRTPVAAPTDSVPQFYVTSEIETI